MPCMTYETPEERAVDNQKAAQRVAKETYDPLLCSACRVLERMGYDFDENPTLSVWWEQHKRDDAEKEHILKQEAQRKQFRERLAQEALAKPLKDLSKEERKLLKELGYL
jgi:hypothetical protein